MENKIRSIDIVCEKKNTTWHGIHSQYKLYKSEQDQCANFIQNCITLKPIIKEMWKKSIGVFSECKYCKISLYCQYYSRKNPSPNFILIAFQNFMCLETACVRQSFMHVRPMLVMIRDKKDTHNKDFLHVLTFATHCNKNPIYVFIIWELRSLSPNYHVHVSVSDLYIPRIGPHQGAQRYSVREYKQI